MSMRHLLLGGARSGKTRIALDHAHEWAQRLSANVAYVATAQALDVEMGERIARHREERPMRWTTVEAPLDLASTLMSIPASNVVVIDCLTLWLSNALLLDFDEARPRAALATWASERDAFIAWLTTYSGVVMIVSNEVGSGIVPMYALSRRFQDEQGWLNQAVARICDRVTLVVAGIPLSIKGA
jgi:adenosylcobinamide kinase/adenosylcobinamide-phosphate guanylyltransferase